MFNRTAFLNDPKIRWYQRRRYFWLSTVVSLVSDVIILACMLAMCFVVGLGGLAVGLAASCFALFSTKMLYYPYCFFSFHYTSMHWNVRAPLVVALAPWTYAPLLYICRTIVVSENYPDSAATLEIIFVVVLLCGVVPNHVYIAFLQWKNMRFVMQWEMECLQRRLVESDDAKVPPEKTRVIHEGPTNNNTASAPHAPLLSRSGSFVPGNIADGFNDAKGIDQRYFSEVYTASPRDGNDSADTLPTLNLYTKNNRADDDRDHDAVQSDRAADDDSDEGVVHIEYVQWDVKDDESNDTAGITTGDGGDEEMVPGDSRDGEMVPGDSGGDEMAPEGKYANLKKKFAQMSRERPLLAPDKDKE